jgi:hypothetical protein
LLWLKPLAASVVKKAEQTASVVDTAPQVKARGVVA